MNNTNMQKITGENRWNRNDLYYMLLLAGTTLLFILALTGGQHLFGSQVDWMNQHSVLPDYFRQQFYETGKLVPEFAPHLGAGQNIFHFSYYGLLSPVILPSYLFPGLPMTTYLSIVSILLVVISGALCYIWLRSRKLPVKAVVAASLLFQFSASLLYHSHKHVMFVNYLPFLLLALIGVDRYFEKKKSGLMMTGIFLMTMTSYFFSIGGIFAITIYGIYTYLKTDGQYCRSGSRKEKVLQFIKAGFFFALRIIFSVGCAALLLLPSLGAILNGRSDAATAINPVSLLIPRLSLENLIYSPYGIGLTAVSVLALFRLFASRRPGERTLAGLLFVLFTIPAFLYLLNGGLYLRGKVFLPLLPLLVFITGLWFSDLLTGLAEPIDRKNGIPLLLLFVLLLVLDRSWFWLVFAAESVFVIFGIVLAKKKQKFFWCAFPSCLVCLGVCIGVNLSDPLVTVEKKQEIYHPQKQELLQEAKAVMKTPYARMNDFTASKESCNLIADSRLWRTSLYTSTYNKGYNEFFTSGIGNARNTTNEITCADNNNLLFQTFMGVSYLISRDGAPAGYEKIAQRGDYQFFENPQVFPIAWGSSELMSKEEFDMLSVPQKNVALLQRIIVDFAPDSGYVSPLKQEQLSLPLPQNQTAPTYQASFSEPKKITLPLEHPLNERFLFLSFSFDKDPEKADIVVQANQTVNRLTRKKSLYPNSNYTFEYWLSDNTANQEVTLEFSPGSYEFSIPQLYSLDARVVTDAVKNISPLVPADSARNNQVLSGKITLKQDGYFTASIPYDPGFRAYVDGREQPVELVNTAFLGFPLSAGEHTIELVYHAPLYMEGLWISILCFLGFTGILGMEWWKTHSHNAFVKKKFPNPNPKPNPQPVFALRAGED